MLENSEPIQSSSADCEICGDSKILKVPDGTGVSKSGKLIQYFSAKPCECILLEKFQRQLLKVPEIFRAADLFKVKAQPHIHEAQSAAIEAMRMDSTRSFAFIGDFGTGKTHLFYCLHNYAAKTSRKVYASTLRGLIDNYQQTINRSRAGELNAMPEIRAVDLQQSHTKYSIFLDDLDKAKPSEYVAEQLFELVDSAVNFKHQLCWTSNLTIDELGDHFKRADQRFGGAIVRRLQTATEVVEMW